MITNEEINHALSLSSLIYINAKACSSIGLKLIQTIYDKETDTQGAVMVDYLNMKLYIVFRGTKGERDILTDLECLQEKATIQNRDCSIHKGFLKAYKSVKSQIDSIPFAQFENYDIITCGHSLGGALATICGADLSTTNKIYTVTFGSPRVGNTKFVSIFKDHVTLYYRFVHHNDIVPTIPRINYNHVGQQIRLDHNGKEISYMNLWRRLIYWIKGKQKLDLNLVSLKDHFMDEYIRVVTIWCNRT
jgi:predicted lipase